MFGRINIGRTIADIPLDDIGTKGRRAALPSASIMIHQPQGQARGQATDIDIYRREARRTRGQVLDILSKHTGKTVDVLDKDTNRPLYMGPADAIKYGVIDKVYTIMSFLYN